MKNYRKKLQLDPQKPNTPADKPFDFQQCFSLPHIPYFMKELNKFLIKECQLIPVYNYPCKLNSIIKLQKDKIETVNKLNSVYKINCIDCDKCYAGQSQRLVSTKRDKGKKKIYITIQKIIML